MKALLKTFVVYLICGMVGLFIGSSIVANLKFIELLTAIGF